jgi:hypothetical protein
MLHAEPIADRRKSSEYVSHSQATMGGTAVIESDMDWLAKTSRGRESGDNERESLVATNAASVD